MLLFQSFQVIIGVAQIIKAAIGRSKSKYLYPVRRLEPPSGGRVTSVSLDLKTENWRHERPLVPWVGGTRENPLFRNTGDPVASGIALANGVGYFTTFSSNKLVAVDLSTGSSLKEIYLGPVLAGPSVSRGRIYQGTGNTHFTNSPKEA